MSKVKVGVAGYGVIGLRLATGVALQKDMELVGVSDVAPTLAVRGLVESGMPYDFYNALPENEDKLKAAGVPISGTLEDLVEQCDVILDATSAGIGAKNKELYSRMGKKAIFQGGEKNNVADVFFHGYANYEKGLGQQFLKLTSCNTTGLIRAVDMIDRAVGMEKVAITIIRRVADPGDYHRGLTNALQMEYAPSHQALDLMNIMPHAEPDSEHQAQHACYRHAPDAVLSFRPVPDQKPAVRAVSPELPELLRHGLSVGIGLKNIVCPVLHRVPVPEEHCRSMSAVLLVKRYELRQAAGTLLQHFPGAVPAAVVHHYQTAVPAGPHRNLMPLLHSFFDIHFLVICRNHNIQTISHNQSPNSNSIMPQCHVPL